MWKTSRFPSSTSYQLFLRFDYAHGGLAARGVLVPSKSGRSLRDRPLEARGAGLQQRGKVLD